MKNISNVNIEYNRLDKAISRYEEYKYPTHKISWITDRICWAYKFRKISDIQKDELCERIINVMNMEST